MNNTSDFFNPTNILNYIYIIIIITSIFGIKLFESKYLDIVIKKLVKITLKKLALNNYILFLVLNNDVCFSINSFQIHLFLL